MRRSLFASLFLLLAAACQPAADTGSPMPEARRGPLVSSMQVETGPDSVRFVLQVTNPTTAPVRLTFPSGMTHDFVVREGTRELWRWSAGRMFVQSVVSIALPAGETRSYAEVWRPAASLRGRRLTAEGRLTSSSHPVQNSTPFTLP